MSAVDKKAIFDIGIEAENVSTLKWKFIMGGESAGVGSDAFRNYMYEELEKLYTELKARIALVDPELADALAIGISEGENEFKFEIFFVFQEPFEPSLTEIDPNSRKQIETILESNRVKLETYRCKKLYYKGGAYTIRNVHNLSRLSLRSLLYNSNVDYWDLEDRCKRIVLKYYELWLYRWFIR